jgi:DNA processing protein
MTAHLHNLLWLAALNVPGIGPKTLWKMWAKNSDINLIWDQLELTQIERQKFLAAANDQVECVERVQATIVTASDVSFPQQLRQSHDVSPVLFVRGQALSIERCMAVVGTREPSSYGKQTTRSIVEHLVAQGYGVVSGMARGVDTIAHEACLNARGRTLAVWGTGIDQPYPEQNAPLATRIVETGGTIVTQFMPGTLASKYTFPARNALIAALAEGVIVTEAKARSGALLTAEEALKRQKKVWSVPGSVFSLNSRGTNSLLAMGARPVIDVTAIVEPGGNGALISPLSAQSSPLTAQEKHLLSLMQSGAAHVDEILRLSAMAPSDVLAALVTLELQDFIIKNGEEYVAR